MHSKGLKKYMLVGISLVLMVFLSACSSGTVDGELSDDPLLGKEVTTSGETGESSSTGGQDNTTIKTVNQRPIAQPQNISMVEDSQKSILLLGMDPDKDTLTYTLLSEPTHGSIKGTMPSMIYRPNPNYTGTDEFSFKVNDGLLDSKVVQVQINITPVNDDPIAEDDNETTMEGQTVSIYPLVNDSDEEGDSLSIISVSKALYGSVLVNNDTVFYAPHTNHEVVDSFSYTISDGHGGEANATISVHVISVNDMPVIKNQTIYLEEEQTVSFEMNASDPDGDDLTYMIDTETKNGIVNGTAPKMTYTPKKDYNGKDYLVYYVNDGTLDSYLGVIEFIISPLNDPPVANAGPDYTGKRGDIVTFDASGSYDTDGNITGYIWKDKNITLSTEKIFTERLYDEGEHTIVLTVTDDSGSVASDEKTVTLKACCKGCNYPDPTQTNPYN